MKTKKDKTMNALEKLKEITEKVLTICEIEFDFLNCSPDEIRVEEKCYPMIEVVACAYLSVKLNKDFSSLLANLEK